jgi:hypothetical protein
LQFKKGRLNLTRSTFPQAIDSFDELFDLPPSLVASAKRYQELKIRPTLNATEQTELNGLSNSLGSYIITPETWNKLADAIVNVETFFSQEVDGYVKMKQLEWDTYIKGFKSAGAYSASVTYTFSNMVTYSGSLFFCLAKSVKGTAPNPSADTAVWQKISSKGEKGDVGLNIHLKGAYSSATAYAVSDAVIFEGRLYYCIKATTAGISPTNAANWFLYEGTIVGGTMPTSAQKGTTWIEVLG